MWDINLGLSASLVCDAAVFLVEVIGRGWWWWIMLLWQQRRLIILI